MSSVPAWKRLGLKLKAAPDGQTNGVPSQTTAVPSTPAHISGSAKRKPSGAPAGDHSAKKLRTEAFSTTPKTPKSVSFASEPDYSPAPATNGLRLPKKPKQKQDKPKATKSNSEVKPLAKKENAVANLQSAVHYLQQWHTARDSWKFNKNHQTRLLEYVFSAETPIPAADINVFYEYISPLKGYVRKRLREAAEEIKRQDMEQGAEGFPSSNKDVAGSKQKEYEEVIAGFLKESRTPEKRRFEEVEYVLRTADMEMQRRVVKRMRAEMVLDELSGSEEDSETTTSTATVTETAPESPAGESSKDTTAAATDGDKRVKLNDGTLKRVRKRKVRTAEVQDSSSSSEGGEDSDSDTSSSDSDESSDESSSDNAMQVDAARNDEDTSSSSSSSSSEADSSSEGESSGDES